MKAAALLTGFYVSCLAPVEGMEAWVLSSGHCVCETCAETESRMLSALLEDRVSSCLSCLWVLHCLYKFGLDVQACCGTCSLLLLSGGVLFEEMVARLVLVWLNICHSHWPAKFMVASHLFPRKFGRRLLSACVSHLSQHDTPAASALHLVVLRSVALVFAVVTLRWLHDGGEHALLDHN